MTTSRESRRNFLKNSSLGIATLSMLEPQNLFAGPSQEAAPSVYRVLPLKPSTLSMEGISARTMQEHHKLYAGYVNKSNEILNALKSADRSKANQISSDLRALKVEFTFAVGGVKNHELYFDHLGGKGGKPEGKLMEYIVRNFGSYEQWEEDLKATGMAARGWVWLAYDRDRGTLFNYLGDAQNTFPIWNAVPILALDTYEHAYFLDYATDRRSYITAFLRNLDWKVVEARFSEIPDIP